MSGSITNNTGYSLCEQKTKAKVTGLSLHTTNSINYAPMMASDEEERDNEKWNKPNKTRPKPNQWL